jgi:hypothetical protein
MSANKPTTPKDDTTVPSPTDYWREKEALAGGSSGDEVEASQVESEAIEEEFGRTRVLPRPTRIVVAAVLTVLAVALAWVVVPALVGGGSTSQSRSAPGGLPAKTGKAGRGRSSRTRWAREPDANSRPRPRSALGARRGGRRTHPRHARRHPSPPPPDDPIQPPASGTAAPEPSAPAPPPQAEPKEEPRLRDGATESTEFGL